MFLYGQSVRQQAQIVKVFTSWRWDTSFRGVMPAGLNVELPALNAQCSRDLRIRIALKIVPYLSFHPGKATAFPVSSKLFRLFRTAGQPSEMESKTLLAGSNSS